MEKELKKRKRRVYLASSDKPFKISRSGIEMFLECSCCFYNDKRLGVKRPQGFPFNLNRAVDILLTKEFDIHRANKTTHPLMKLYGIDAVPFQHPLMDEWRENFKGIQHLHKPTSLLITGAIDDIWINKKGELIVVDYKATAKEGELNMDAGWQNSYRNQIEVTQWLLRQLGFKVTNTSYFLYCNGKTDREALDGKLEFDTTLIRYEGDDMWVEEAVTAIKGCLQNEYAPDSSNLCEFCSFANKRAPKTVVFI